MAPFTDLFIVLLTLSASHLSIIEVFEVAHAGNINRLQCPMEDIADCYETIMKNGTCSHRI